ncbi:MAG: hypothetical protein B6I28_02965 [Fusobacteriia bacterium 4572_132]|nr:MAG: hypothetical protein B6I28_02965 [Fusobacteriia bacterium 4572_132]
MEVGLPNRLAGVGLNHSTLLNSKEYGSERLEKSHNKICQMSIKETNASEPLMRCRKRYNL